MKVAIRSRCGSNFFTAFRTIGKNLTVVGKRRRQLTKELFILFWISFRFVLNLVRSNLTTDTGTEERRDISKQIVVGNVLKINPNCLKERLKTNSKGWGDNYVGKKFGVNYTIIGRIFWYRMEF